MICTHFLNVQREGKGDERVEKNQVKLRARARVGTSRDLGGWSCKMASADWI
jgi:hypothetical protein